MFADVSAISVFLYGLASFLSPCVLPLIPSYILLLAGGGKNKAPLHGGAFVLGFSILFVAMGATAGSIGRFLMDHRLLLTRVCGGIVEREAVVLLTQTEYERIRNISAKYYDTKLLVS